MREKDIFAVSVVLAVFFAVILITLGFEPIKLHLRGVKSTFFAVTGGSESDGKNVAASCVPENIKRETEADDFAENNAQPIQDEKSEEMLVYGGMGVLLIPSINVTVPLYEGDVYDNPVETQAIVDADDSAAVFEFEGVKVIAEHVDQTFGELSKVKEGDCAIIKQKDGSEEEYICTGNFLGKNVGSTLIDTNGASVSKMVKDGIVIYTCTDNWEDVTVTIWEKKRDGYNSQL